MSLLYINWNYTHICKFTCAHCYSRAPKYTKECSTANNKEIVRKLIDIPVFSVGFGGGEALERKDFLEIVSLLSQNGIHTHFTTNGWGIDSKKAKEIKESGINRVTVSFDSADKSVHDRIRGKEGSFDAAISTTRRLIELDIETWLSITLSKINITKVSELLDLGRNLGVAGINFKVIRPSGNASILKESLVPNDQDIDTVKLTISQQNEIEVTLYGPENASGCSCGNTTLTIRPDGNVSFCPYSGLVLGNALDIEFSELYLRAQKYISESCLGKEGDDWPLAPENMSDSRKEKHINKLKNSEFMKIDAIQI